MRERESVSVVSPGLMAVFVRIAVYVEFCSISKGQGLRLSTQPCGPSRRDPRICRHSHGTTTHGTPHGLPALVLSCQFPRVLSRAYTSSPLTTPHGTRLLVTASPPVRYDGGGKATLWIAGRSGCYRACALLQRQHPHAENGNPGGSPASACSRQPTPPRPAAWSLPDRDRRVSYHVHVIRFTPLVTWLKYNPPPQPLRLY